LIGCGEMWLEEDRYCGHANVYAGAISTLKQT
jgi:hypothetical protein